MSGPYPSAPRKLTRSTTNKVVGGVCGGLAAYLNMDANLVRILTVVITFFTGVPVLLYVLALFLVPEDVRVPPGVSGATPRPQDDVWGSSGAPWEQGAARPADDPERREPLR